jgi:hypothetical protein
MKQVASGGTATLPPKRLLTFNGLHGINFQKIVLAFLVGLTSNHESMLLKQQVPFTSIGSFLNICEYAAGKKVKLYDSSSLSPAQNEVAASGAVKGESDISYTFS